MATRVGQFVILASIVVIVACGVSARQGAESNSATSNGDVVQGVNDNKDGIVKTYKDALLSSSSEGKSALQNTIAGLKETTTGRVLTRVKRCGGNRGDDDGDANRARRARRARRTRKSRTNRVLRRRNKAAKRNARKAARRAAKTTTTVRKVIHNGQLVSQTTETQGGALTTLPTGQVVQSVGQQPTIVVK